MTKNIGTDANIDQVRLKQETSHPASPASGYELLYIISGSANGGLFVKDSAGRQIGPFITGSAPSSGGGRTLISSVSPTGTTATFSGIPQTYKLLTIEVIARSTAVANGVDCHLQFNADTTAGNYRYNLLRYNATGSAIEAGANFKIAITTVPAASSPANALCNGIIQIVNYASTTINKLALQSWAAKYDASSIFLQTQSGSMEWINVNPITQIDVLLSSGNFVASPVCLVNLYGE